MEYRILLEAYKALANKDYRKSIIESATAVEVSMTNRIKKEFDSQNIRFGEQLLKQFKMLGKRLELAKMLNIALPIAHKTVTNSLIEPRNKVIHEANFANRQLAQEAIKTAEILLKEFSPDISE